MSIKLLSGKTEIPVDFHGAKIKAKKLGGYELVCPIGGENVTVTEDEIKSAGTYSMGKPAGPSAWESVSHGSEYFKEWDEAMAAAKSGSVDYIDWRVKVAQVNQKIAAYSFPLSTTFATELKLSCGHSIPITFGESIEIAKEPDRIEMFLKLGVKGEKSYRWFRYIFAEENAPVSIGEKRAKEIVDFIRRLEDEKNAIKVLSDKIMAETEKLGQGASDFGRRVAEFVSSKHESEVELLKQAQLEQLDRIDKTLQRVAMRPEPPQRGD